MVRKAKAKTSRDKMDDLIEIMARVHALADYAWPRDDCGVSPMTPDAERLIIDIQERAAKALRLPIDTPLLTGDWVVDSDIISDQP